MNLTNDDVVEILKLLDESPYDELDLTTSRFRLRLSRGEDGWTEESVIGDADLPQSDAAQPVGATADAKQSEPGLYDLYPPLPGTFYRAPKPGADPFVEVGDAVSEDSTVGIVETMKLMNSVPAGVNGTVVAILAENGSMVETGQPIMQIRLDDA